MHTNRQTEDAGGLMAILLPGCTHPFIHPSSYRSDLTSCPPSLPSNPLCLPSLSSFIVPVSQQIDRWGLKTFVDFYEEPCITQAELNAANSTHALLDTNVNCLLAKSYRCLTLVCPSCIFMAYRDFNPSKIRERGTRECGKLCRGRERSKVRCVLEEVNSCWWLLGCSRRSLYAKVM